jgi:hypothetical protein
MHRRVLPAEATTPNIRFLENTPSTAKSLRSGEKTRRRRSVVFSLQNLFQNERIQFIENYRAFWKRRAAVIPATYDIEGELGCCTT